MMLKIQLFGSPNLIQNGRDLNLRRRKAIAMLAYLAVTRQPKAHEPAPRPVLAAAKPAVAGGSVLVDRYQLAGEVLSLLNNRTVT